MSTKATKIFDKTLEEKEPDSDYEEKPCKDEEHLPTRKTGCRKVPVTTWLLHPVSVAVFAVAVFAFVVLLSLWQWREISALKHEIADLRLQINSGNQIKPIEVVEDGANISELIVNISKNSQEISRLDYLNSTQMSQGQMLLSIQTQLMQSESAQKSTSKNIVRLKQELRKTDWWMRSRLNKTHQQWAVLSSQLVSVSQSHDTHQVLISEIQRNITAIVSKQVQADHQLTSLESSNQSQSQEISSLQANTLHLKNQLIDTKGQVADNKKKISKSKSHISFLQSNVSSLKKQVSDTMGQVSDNKKKISEAEGCIRSLQSDISPLKKQVSDTKEQVTDNKRKIGEADDHISSLQSDTSNLTNQFTDTKGQVTDNKRKISETEGRIHFLQSDSFQVQKDQGGIKERVKKLENFHSGSHRASSTYTYYFTIFAVIVFLV